MVTLEEIARLSGASRSTVSRVVNNDPHVSDKTRMRVLEVVRKLNYQPNAIARSLAAGRTHVLGVIINSIEMHRISSLYYAYQYPNYAYYSNAYAYGYSYYDYGDGKRKVRPKHHRGGAGERFRKLGHWLRDTFLPME